MLACAVAPAAPAHGATTERISLSSFGGEMHNPYFGRFPFLDPWPSADGRLVAFATPANDLVAGDNNTLEDIYVRDRKTKETTRASVGIGGEANAGSLQPSLSADGRFVSFKSYASNLVPGDTNGKPDCFVYDRQAKVTERVSVKSGGAEAGKAGGGECWEARISADGSTVAFLSDFSDLVADDSNGTFDIFAFDRASKATTRVSLSSDDAEAGLHSGHPDLSGDGRYVVWESIGAFDLSRDFDSDSDVYMRDRSTGVTSLMSSDGGGQNRGGPAVRPTISDDGNIVAFESDSTLLINPDANGTVRDIFTKNRLTGEVKLVNRNSTGAQASGGISLAVSLDRTGRRVVFESDATNLVTPDVPGRDIFMRDTATGTTERLNVDSGGSTTGGAILPVVNATGRYVVFQTSGVFEPADTNNQDDVYLRDVGPNQAPVPAFDVTAPTADSILVDASPSVDPDGWIVSYRYTFGDGGTAGGPVGPHTYAAPGTYTVSLTVTDQDGATATTSKSVSVTAEPPPPPPPPPASSIAPPPPLPPAVATPRLVFAPMRLPLRPDARGRVGVKLRCTSTVSCSGRLALIVPKQGTRRARALGSAAFSLDGRRTATVKVKLSTVARKLLASRSRLIVSARATSGKTRLATRSLTLAKRRRTR